MRRSAAALLLLALTAGPAMAGPLSPSVFRRDGADPVIMQAQDEQLLPPGDVAPEPGQQPDVLLLM